MINVGLVTGVQDVTHISPALYQLIQSVTFILHALILLIEKNICIYGVIISTGYGVVTLQGFLGYVTLGYIILVLL